MNKHKVKEVMAEVLQSASLTAVDSEETSFTNLYEFSLYKNGGHFPTFVNYSTDNISVRSEVSSMLNRALGSTTEAGITTPATKYHFFIPSCSGSGSELVLNTGPSGAKLSSSIGKAGFLIYSENCVSALEPSYYRGSAAISSIYMSSSFTGSTTGSSVRVRYAFMGSSGSSYQDTLSFVCGAYLGGNHTASITAQNSTLATGTIFLPTGSMTGGFTVALSQVASQGHTWDYGVMVFVDIP